MNSSAPIEDDLCTRCGLCCDGSLFGDVAMANQAEAESMECLGLEIDFDKPSVLLQPCTALDGKRCTIYHHRPTNCRKFECRLLEDVKAGNVALSIAINIVTETREQVDALDALCVEAGETSEDLPLKERCIEVLAQPVEGDDDQAQRLRGEISIAMDAMGGLLNEHFLGG